MKRELIELGWIVNQHKNGFLFNLSEREEKIVGWEIRTLEISLAFSFLSNFFPLLKKGFKFHFGFKIIFKKTIVLLAIENVTTRSFVRTLKNAACNLFERQ